MAGSWCVAYKSIRRVPRRTIGFTIPAIARPNASSSGVNVGTPVAFFVLLAACDGSVRSVGAGTLVGDDTLAQKSVSIILRQAFGTHDSRKKCLVSQILFDRSQGILAGQKRGAHAGRGIVRRDESRLLKFHLQDCVALVELWRPREVTQRQEKAGQNANRYDPNTFEERMPIPAKIEPAPSLGVLPGEISQRRFTGIGRNGRSCTRVRRINHGGISTQTYTQAVRSERRRRKIFVRKYFPRR